MNRRYAFCLFQEDKPQAEDLVYISLDMCSVLSATVTNNMSIIIASLSAWVPELDNMQLPAHNSK